MITATCSGTVCARTRSSSSVSPSFSRSARAGTPDGVTAIGLHRTRRVASNGSDLLLLLLHELVDLADESVRRLLDLVVTAPLLVFGDGRLLVLHHRLQLVVRLAADVADGDPTFFRHLADVLRELLPALLRHRRHREADDLAVVHGRDAEIGLEDGLLDRP